MALNGKLYNQDGVLAQQADKHDQGYLCIDIIIQTEEFEGDKRTENTGRQTQDYR
ncbi:hypothetical protein D3C80_1735470 [compost metagenome]